MANSSTLERIQADLKVGKIQIANVEYKEFKTWRSYTKTVEADDLAIVISARKATLSYNSYLDKMPAMLARNYETSNFVIIYPEQAIANPENQPEIG